MWTSEFNIKVIISQDEGSQRRLASFYKPDGTRVFEALPVDEATGFLANWLETALPEDLVALDIFGNQRQQLSPSETMEALAAKRDADDVRREVFRVQDEGRADFERSVGEHDGPYTPGTPEHQYWTEGWKSAQAVARFDPCVTVSIFSGVCIRGTKCCTAEHEGDAQ